MKRIEENLQALNERSGHEEDTFSQQELGVGEYYEQPSHVRRQRKEHTPKEVKIDLPYFYGKDIIEAYLDWEMKVEQLFECH